VATPTVTIPATHRIVPDSLPQVLKLTRYQLREYLRSRRFLALLGIVVIIGVILSAVVGHFRGVLVSDHLSFYGNFWGSGVYLVIVLSAVFFGGDAIAGEFQNKTGYFLMGLPIRRSTVYVAKFIAAFLASTAMVLLFLVILVGNGAFYFGGGLFPWQLALSLVLAIAYLAAVLGATFLFSSLFKTSAYGFVLTAILFLFGFSILESLVSGLIKIEPWMVISYAQSTIGGVFFSTTNWGFHGTMSTGVFGNTMYTAGIGEGIVIMVAYFLVTALFGLLLFEREEFS
jgi:ABC-2 type transport system permease protein